ncbi:MAG: tetratricopeptide repeat protein [Ignavibacteriaceae bacterium]|jgi:tetratricopeptide (TPR) repeat protein|nr:tetratricopeptide repeat protein [Ignavibacteriaceae bacterium]
MNEMLGNQYFLARKYSLAHEVFEKALKANPNNINVKKKLVVCYTQIGKIIKAKELFFDLISENINYILETDPLVDDCPCPDLIARLESDLSVNEGSYEYHVALGIIWLYCDSGNSLKYFIEARKLNPNDSLLEQIVNILFLHQNKINKTKR